MLHQSRSIIAFYAMISALGNLFKSYLRCYVSQRPMIPWLSLVSLILLSACNPLPPVVNQDSDATVITPPPQISSDLGITELMPDADIPGPLLNSILPNRSPLEGGIPLRIIGDGFRSPMYVRIGENPCLSLTVESEARISCLAPSVESPQTVSVEVAWGAVPREGEISDESRDQYEGALRVIERGLTYFQPLGVESLTPSKGPASGNTEVTITGIGFTETTDVRFGDSPALNVTLQDSQTLTVVTPPHSADKVDVIVRDPSGVIILEDAYTYQVPLGIDFISPQWGMTEGGDLIEVYGYGFTDDTSVLMGGQAAIIIEARPPARLTISAPPRERAGWVELTLENLNGRSDLERAFLYLDSNTGPFEVFGSVPERLPTDLGGSIMIGGNGFTEETQVFMEDQELTCQLENAQQLRCFCPRRALGIVEISVRQGLLSETFSLTYYDTLELFFLEPDRAARSGGAFIRVRGRGFTEETRFSFGDQQVSVHQFISNEEVWIIAPPNPPALLDITVNRDEEQVYLPEAFTYFDPQAQYGGSWGERIQNAVNVTALNIYDFSPIPEVTVELRPFQTPTSLPLVTGQTNEEGQVTVSAESLSTPLHVNIAKSGFEAQTIERVVSENLTVLLFPFIPPEGEGDPPPPPEPVRIQGVLTGLNELEKPPEPGVVLRAFIDVSHGGMLSRSVNPAPAPLGILSEDGPFDLFTRPGQMAVIATAAYVPQEELSRYERGEISYWFLRKSIYPIKMGMIRYLSLSPEAEISGLNLSLNHPLEERASVKLLNPSTGAGVGYLDRFGNPASIQSDFEVRAFLDLDADGYWELDINATSDSSLLSVRGLPNLEEWPDQPELIWFAMSRVHPAGVNSYAEHIQSDLTRQVDIGPFVGAARVLDRNSGDPISIGETLRWDYWPGIDRDDTEPPQATTIRFYQAGLPVWSFTLPGGVNELTIPPLPPEEPQAGAAPGSIYVSIEPLISEVGINYQDYNLLDLNNPSSYSTTRFEIIFDP